MQVDYVALFLIGLLGGFSHCVGMCSGFVMTYTLKIKENERVVNPSKWRSLSPHLLYNSGRLLTYLILGEIFGLLGTTLGVLFALRDFQGVLQLVAGIVMLFMGLDLAGLIPSLSPNTFPGVNRFKNLIRALFNRVSHRNIFGLGVVLGFIPCGLVYAAGAKAAATQSILGGMLTMLFFGLGTFPAMVLIGMTTHFFTQKLRSKLYKMAAFLVIILAVITILRGIDALGWIHFYWLF
jgi:sulfite exporter TauE/SafE